MGVERTLRQTSDRLDQVERNPPEIIGNSNPEQVTLFLQSVYRKKFMLEDELRSLLKKQAANN
jgi:hypothetical protein